VGNEVKNVRNIVLIGFMGTGKSTIGRALAERLGWLFVDTDQLVQVRSGRTIPELFAQKGEAYFRSLETSVIADTAGGERQVVSTGGGAVLREENRKLLLSAGLVVALKAPPETVLERVAKDTGRPLLQGDREANIRRLMEERRTAYDFAHVFIDTSEWDVIHAVERIMDEAGYGL
jgi:shikimate kinase